MGCIQLSIRILQTSLILSICLVPVLLCAVQSEASEKPTLNIHSRTLKIGLDPNLQPFTYLDEDGVATGFDVELVRTILDEQQVEYEFFPALWHKNYKALKNAEIDLHPSVMKTNTREVDLDFTVSVGWFNVILFVRDGSSIQNLDDLNNSEVLVERDTIWDQWVTENAPHVKRILLDSSEEVLKRLSAGEGDAAVVMLDNGHYFKRKLNLKNINSIGEPLFVFDSRVALPEGYYSTLALLNDGITKMRQNGSYDALYDKWFGVLRPDPWISTSGKKIVGISGLILIGILALFAVWSRILNRRLRERTKNLESSLGKLKLAQTVIDTIHEMVWIKDTENNHITVNKSAAKSVGFTIEELKGTNMKEHFPDDAEGFYKDDLDVIKTKKPKLGIIERISAKDEKLWISTDKYPIFGDDETVTGVLVIVTDITKQKEVQNALEESESQMELAQTVIDTIHDMVWIKDTENNHITVNKSAAESVGKTVEELKGSSAYELFAGEAEAYYQDDLEVIKTKKPKLGIIERLSAKDEKLWIRTDKYPIFDDSNSVTGILVVVTDVTKQREVQNALETREHVLSEAEQLANIGSWEHDFLNNLVYFSRGTSKIVDINTEKSVLPYDESFIVIHPEDRRRVFYEYNESVKNKTKYNTYHRLRLRDGSIRYVNQVCKTYYDDEGVPTRSIGIVHDITTLKELELNTLETQTQLAHVDRLNTLGQLSSSIAHEINQPLTSISQFCSSAKLRLNKVGNSDNAAMEYLESAIQQSQRAGEIIRRLRSLVAKNSSSISIVDVNQVVNESLMLLQSALHSKNVKVILNLSELIPKIMLDEVQLQQVVINLVRNSIDAMDVDSNIGATKEKVIAIKTLIYGDNSIMLSVQDNGPGIDTDHIDTLFDAYVTSSVDGMGLGLSICKSIVEAHNGKIRVDQSVNCGARFEVLFPY